jgi:DNA repair protein RecO (recombination protein O)
MRNSQVQAIILKTNPVSEIHRGVTLFTRSRGIISAMAYGAESGKGKLKGITMPFCYGTFYLYTDPVKGNNKITDGQIRSYFEGIRKNIVTFYTASLWTEAVLKSYGGGGGGSMFPLFIRSLQILEKKSGEEGRTVSIQFFTRFLKELGVSPELNCCSRCGVSYAEMPGPKVREGELMCRDCGGEYPELSLGAHRYLQHTAGRSLEEAVKVGLDEGSQHQLLTYLHNLVQSELEVPLNTLKSGRSILEGKK